MQQITDIEIRNVHFLFFECNNFFSQYCRGFLKKKKNINSENGKKVKENIITLVEHC